MKTRLLFGLSVCGGLIIQTADADYTYMGHCTADPSVPGEEIISACTNFISKAFQENWQLEYVPAAMLFQASAYERLGKDDRALATLKALITRYPRFPQGWVGLGQLLEKLKGPGMLMGTMDAMLHANPDDATVLNEACWIRATTGQQLDTAIADCTAALQIKPGDPGFLDSRGLAYFRKGDFAEATKDTSAALAVDPKKSGSLYVRGLAKMKSGDAAGGNADIAAAKAMDPTIADTYAAYGVSQ
ncbi:MAG TPA: tetratricopeptide repeat protein [Rhizomicrobium sp.]